LFTVCPKCTLTLVVTTVDLRAGQGYVRCGRCANVFNALIALREGDPNNLSDTASRRLQETAPRPSVEPALGAGVHIEPEPESEPEPELEVVEEHIEEIELSGDEPAANEESLEFDAAATDVSEIFITAPAAEHDTSSGNYEAVVLAEESEVAPAADESIAAMDDESHRDTIVSGEWSLLDEDPPAEALPETAEEPPPQTTGSPPDAPWVQEMFAEAEAEADRIRTAELEILDRIGREPDPPPVVERKPAIEVAETTAPVSDAAIGALLAPTQRRASWQMMAGITALVLLLIGQIIHYNRQGLVLSASIGPAITRVYGWFGATLTPRWDLTAYAVKQLGAEAEGAEGSRLRVRLSLQNQSTRVQPLPLLRLTLEDRFGNPVSTRDLEPAEYLPKNIADQRLLEPDQRIDAELHVLDPAKSAMGFVIDACLRGASGRIGCASDARAQRAAG
jgi:predicted Zn finger-like uncharacterized protein